MFGELHHLGSHYEVVVTMATSGALTSMCYNGPSGVCNHKTMYVKTHKNLGDRLTAKAMHVWLPFMMKHDSLCTLFILF